MSSGDERHNVQFKILKQLKKVNQHLDAVEQKVAENDHNNREDGSNNDEQSKLSKVYKKVFLKLKKRQDHVKNV